MWVQTELICLRIPASHSAALRATSRLGNSERPVLLYSHSSSSLANLTVWATDGVYK